MMKYQYFITLSLLLLNSAAYPTDQYKNDKKSDTDIIVEGRRPTLKGGDWSITLSRSYTHGTAYNSEEMRPTGRDKTWHVCLANTDVEPLIRVLVGEGQTPSATGHCSKIAVNIGSEKIRANQSCFGTTMLAPNSDGSKIDTYSRSNDHGMESPKAYDHTYPEQSSIAPIQAKNLLSIAGYYSKESFRLNFASVQEPAVMENSPEGPPIRNERHWSIKGDRQGDCVQPH